MERTMLLLSSGYSATTRVLVGMLTVFCIGAFAVATVVDEETLTPPYWVMAVGLGILAVAGLSDLFFRRVWIYSDRIVSRELFQKRTIYLRDVAEILRGGDRTLVKATDGRSVMILGKFSHYDRIVHEIAHRSGKSIE